MSTTDTQAQPLQSESNATIEEGALSTDVALPPPQQQAREITQTDHLNKQLLSAAMARFASMFPAPVGPESDDEDMDDDYDDGDDDGDDASAGAGAGAGDVVDGGSGTSNDAAIQIQQSAAQPAAQTAAQPTAQPTAEATARPIDFRIVTSATGVRSSLLAGYRLPADVTAAQSADEIAALTQQIQKERAGEE